MELHPEKLLASPSVGNSRMIVFLNVSNLAIVERFEIEPREGLNILTGETGAGKSLLIDSLQFLSGARGTTDQIRTGADRMVAEAIFEVPLELSPLLEEMGVEPEVRNGTIQVIARRELLLQGRGRAQINGVTVPARDLQRLTDQILEIHGQQNPSNARIAGQSFRGLLDQWAKTTDLVANLEQIHGEWKESHRILEERKQAQRDRSHRLDLLRYQIQEIEAARLIPGEEEELRSERARLAHAEEMLEAAAGAYSAVLEDDDSALSQVARAAQKLERLADRIDEIRPLHEELEEIRLRLQEVGRSIAAMGDSIRMDPRRLEEIEERLVLLERLRKKYGSDIGEILDTLAAAIAERDELEDWEASLARLEQSERDRFEAYRQLALDVSTRRRDSVPELERRIRQQLHDLAMERTTVRILVSTTVDPESRFELEGKPIGFGPDGIDQVEILIAPNLGEEPKPLQKIASGGELSRIQLAIAVTLFEAAGRAHGTTLVFDEIDAGIGGRVAEVVGRKLRQLAETNQILCVTHLPQIASLGTAHFHVWKEDVEGRTQARIRPLETEDQRVDEIARMLAGETVSDAARAHALELLRDGSAASRRKRRSAPAVS